MNIQVLLEDEMEELRRRNPDVHALLEKIFQHKDGKGDYSVERHKWMETLDKETFLNEVRQLAKDKKTK
ncbi:MAG: hypothetical protein OXN25_12605 [Candidatus Poribacteria bacterium]|nr:hypothetical protein [Candidatus Poribacteria bacterium]MYK19331.1 hypothetical protein [Candidatus Poribacteria bacterium]